VRTTLTLDDDVAAKLRAAARRSGRAFRDVVNDTLRRGLVAQTAIRRTAFRIEPRDLGRTRPGVRLDDIGGLLEHIEGPTHR
jgi:hypothetical protein